MEVFEKEYADILTMNGLDEFIQQTYTAKFHKIYCALIETNKLFNLTAVTNLHDVIALHFADSLLVLKHFPKIFDNLVSLKETNLNEYQGKTLLDVGSGAGFPSLPIAIGCPHLNVLALDSTEKKMRFVSDVAERIKINNLTTAVGRAEELANTKYRHSFDFVTARAVSKLNILCEICLPFLKQDGYFIAMKGAGGIDELNEAKNAVFELGCSVQDVVETNLLLPNSENKRILILIKKINLTKAKYPRKYSQILKKPL